MPEQKESTSIKVIPSLWKKTKIEAICDEIDLGDYVSEAIEFWNKRRSEFKK